MWIFCEFHYNLSKLSGISKNNLHFAQSKTRFRKTASRQNNVWLQFFFFFFFRLRHTLVTMPLLLLLLVYYIRFRQFYPLPSPPKQIHLTFQILTYSNDFIKYFMGPDLLETSVHSDYKDNFVFLSESSQTRN